MVARYCNQEDEFCHDVMKDLVMSRFRMVKNDFLKIHFSADFFSGRAFIMVYYIIKLDLEFQLDLQNSIKQPKM